MKIENKELHHSEELAPHFAPYREEESLISAPQVEKLVSSRSLLLSRSRKSNIRRSIMTISGFAALAALSLLLTHQSEPPAHNKQQTVEPAVTAPVSSPSQDVIGNTQLINTHKSLGSHKFVEDAIKPLRPLSSLEYVWLKKSDFSSFGIGHIQADEIVFYEKSASTVFRKIAIKDVGGFYGYTVNSQDNSQVDLPDGIQVPSFLPIFVTTGEGRKCLFQYRKDDSFEFHTTAGNEQIQVFKDWLINSKPISGLHLAGFDESKSTNSVEGQRVQKDIITIDIGKDMPKFPMLDQVRGQMMAEYSPQVQSTIDSMAKYLEGNGPKPSLAVLSDSISIKSDTLTVSSALAKLDGVAREEEQSEAKVIGGELTNLIPVVVPHDPAYPGSLTSQDYIFWYKPTEDLLKALDYKQIASVSNTMTPNGGILKTLAFPNPTKGKLSVHVEVGQPRTLNVSVRNLLGQEVAKIESINANGSVDSDLDLSKLAEGIYLLDITTNLGEHSVQRIVIEH